MPGLVLNNRVPQVTVKTVTFDGTTWGDIGTDTIATITGRVLLLQHAAYCTTVLAGATATLELGVAGNTAELIAQTTATDIDADEVWRSATPDVGAGPSLANNVVGLSIILTTATAAVTSGVLDFYFRWVPLSSDGQLA